MDNEMDNDYFDPAFTREDLDFALSLEDQFALEGDEKVPFIDPVSGEFMGEISGAEADALTWMNSDTLGYRAFGGAEDQDVAQNRITMGQDDHMGTVKYDLRWNGFRNTTSDIIQHYDIGEIPALAMLNDIAGETTRTNESVRLGGTPGAIFGEQNIPGLRSGPVGSEQNIFAMMGDTGGNVMESLGFFDKSIMGIVASGAGLHSNLVDMSPDRLAPTTREKLLPMMVAAARVMNPGQNTDLLDAASNGDPEAFNGLYNMLKATRLTMGEADFGAATLISHLDEFTDFTQQAKEVGLIEYSNSAQLDLNDTITQVFLVRQTQDLGINGAYAFINGKTPEERAAGLGAVASASTVFGPDFFQQSIAFVSEKDFKPNEGWAKLDDKRRGFLEANGITLDVLIEGGAQIRNQATLLFLADAEIMHIVGHKNRTRLFNKEYGEGSWWGATTRFGGDMYRGMADDPMAQFDMTVGLATGGAGAIRFSARKLAGATFWSNTGRFLVENAVAEGTLGVISGYAASADAQTRLFDRGSTSVQIDSSLQAEDAAFVGAMSAGFSVALPVILGGAVKGTAKAVGGTYRASARGGLLGSRAKEMREAHDLVKLLSNDDLQFALAHSQIPPEVAVRVQASDSAALDIVSTFIKRHVEKNGSSEGWDVHSIEAMLDAGELERHGMSRVEVVNFVMAIATDLGKDGKIGAAELDALFKGYLIQRAEATRANVKADPKAGPTKRAKVSLEELAQGKRGEIIDEPASTVTRAERLQIAMAQRDAEAAANFATSQRVTSDPSPKQRRKAQNTMASLTRGEEVSRGDVKSLIETITAMRDGRAIDSAISFLLDTDMKAYLSDDQLGKIIQDLSEMKIAGRKAIDADPTLRRAIELRAVMTNVANDLTTRSASGLGMTTRQIAKFINAYIATAGNTVQRAKLLNDNPVGKSVIDKLYEDGGVKTLLVDEGRASYDFAAFRRSEEYADIRAVRASRTKLANDINSARAKFSRSSEDLAKALNDIRKNAEKNLREKYNKLGVDDYDAVTAIERMETDAKTFENLTAVERRLLMSNTLTRLVDRVDPELVSPTGTNADRVSLTHMFENTPIADKLEALLARVALFPQSQARLFRSNMRLIRAGAQFIGNQHIGRRRYGSRADLSSIEGVANAAMMETIGVRRAARDMAIKLGSKAYNQFQSALQQLRIRGLLVDDTPAVRAALTKMIAEQMPELLRKYNGNATTMLDDMFNLNNKMTDYFQRVFENAKRNGSMQSSGVDPRKYVPHNLNSRLSATQRADFVKSMAALKQKQYEEDGSQLVLDALVELGWLRRETTKSEVVLEGPNVSVQQINYTVPEDSPFRGISGKTVADDAAYVIKNAERGRAFLTELQDKILTPEAPKPKNAKKRPKKSAVGDDTVTPGTKTEATEPLTPEGQPTPKPIASKPNASERGNASAGDVMRPISRTAEEDGRANFISDLIHHSDPELQALNKRLASMQAIDRENLTDAEIASLIIHYDSALKEVSVRVDKLMAEGDRLLDEAGEVPQGSLRSDMDANDISAAIMDKTLYDAISPSHKALRHNYDELVAQGVLTRESADMVLAAFADIPALKLIGITIRNNDSFLSRASTVFHYNRTLRHELYALAYEGNPNVKSVKGHRGSDTLRSLEQEMADDTTLGAMHPDAISSGGNYPRQLVLDGETIADSVKRNKAGGVANRETSFELEGDVHGDNHDFVSRVLLHEVGHMLFADAPRELKLAVQELYAREVQSITNGEGMGPIAQLFENLGYSDARIEYAFSNVHEFVAVLAELSLFNNRTMRTTASISAGSNSAILRVLASITNAFKQIIRKFVKDNDKLMVVARQTEGLDEVKMRALLDTVYAMAHGRKTQIRHAARLDEVFGLNYDRDQFAVNRYVDRTFWADTSDELGVDWREVQSRTDVEAENTSEIPEFLIDSGRTSMSSFAMTSPRLFAEYAERLGVEPEVLLRRDRGDRLLQTIAETDEGNIRLSPGDFKLAEDMLLDQVAIVDEMLDTATGKNIYSKIVERFGNSGESIFDLMRDRAWIKSRTNTLDSDGTYLQEWEITDALNGLEKAMTIRDEADKSLAKLYNSEKKEPDTYSAIVDKFGVMFEEGFRTVDELASDFPNEAMAYLQRIRELDLKNGGKGSLTQNQQDLMFAARDELDARKEANRLQREGRITRAEEQVTNAKDGDTVRITDADLELLENRLHSDIGAAFDMRDAKSLPEMALAIAELEKVFGRTMNELVDIINNTDSLSFVTGEQKLIKLFEDSETQGYTPEDFERFREVIDEFIETDARANQAKEVIEKIERITIDNTASSNIRPLRSKVTSGLSEDDRLMLEALQASMKQGDLTGPQEQLLRELGDKVMAAENPAVKPTKTKSKNNQWHLRLAEQDQAFQEDLMGAEGIYYGHLNGDIRDSTMAELVDNNGVHTLKSGGRAGESTDVLGLFRAMKDKSLSKEERQGKKRLFLAWVKNAKSSYVSQQISVKKVSEENKTSVALQEQTRLANRESTERPTPGVWVGQIKEKDQDGDSVYGMWEGLRNAARQSSDEETALDIERGLAMIDLLGEFGDELYSAGLISSTPAKRLTDFVASSVDFAGKSNKQIADIRKVYSPTFWVGDKLTGKKSTPEGRELLERIRTAAVERGFGAGGNLGSFTVAVHVRQPATVLEKMYAASADMSKRGILPAAEEAAPVTKPVKAADTGITKASDDANSTGEVGKIAPGSNIDKEGLVKIAEAASDYNEFSRLVRTKYGDKAVDGEHFDIVDDYYNRLNPEVVEAKDTIAEILNIRLYHGGTWDGKTKMRAFTHFGTERSAASDRINEKGPMGEYADDAELTISELDLREDAVILSFRDNGEPHETPTGVIEATINAVLNHLAKSRGDTYGIKLEISRLHARAEYIRTEMFNTVSELRRAGDPEAESLMRMVRSAQQEIMDEYAALLTREGIDGFRYWNSSEGDAPNWSMMMVNDRALVKPEEGAVPRLAEQKPPSQSYSGPNRPDLATVPKKEARADVEATLSRGDSKPMAEKSDVEAVEALEDMPPVEAENAIVNMDGEQAKRVAAEAEAKQAEEEALARELGSTELPVEGSGAAVGKSIDLEDMSLKDLRAYVKDNDLNVSAKSAASLRNKIREAEKAEAITKARAESGEGIPPKDPPKTARGADGEGEEPKPDKKPKKTKKGRSLRIKDDILDLILGRKASEKQVTPSHINPKYKGNLLEEYNAEIASGRAANARAEQYVQTQATNMSSSRINTTQGIDMDVAVKNSMNRLDNRMDREFSDADMEGPEGAELARLFGENSDIEELMVNYGRSVGTKVKLTDVMNELGGTRGYSMADFFAQMEEAGMAILETDAKTGKRNLRATEAEADAFKNYIGQLKHLYLQTLGYNVSKFDKNTALSRGLQVAQNLVYSRLGGTFSASVVLTEGPMNLLRTGGLGPAQLLKNGTTLITGIAQIIGGVTARNIPGMSKFMSALGLDVKRMRYIGEDIVMAMENNNSNALSKFGLAEDAEAGNAAIHSVKGRVAAHGRRIWAGGGDVTEDDRFLGGLTARVEATTAAAADLTGVASGMSQVISLVKSMAISIGQNVLVRHGDGLIRMGEAMAKIKDPLTRKQLIDLGRTHKVPKQAVILAAEAGLLSDGASTLKIMKHELGINYGRGGSRGRDLDLQELQDAINARRENRTYSEAGGMGLDELQARQAEIDDKAVGQVQNFLLLFAQQGSPELKGSMKFTAGDPLRSFLFAMTSYPMAAYQHLVANGVATKSGAAAYGTLSALVVLEYNNRLLQQMLYGKDEETKKKALDKLQRVYSGDIETEDIVEVLAMYGTMSPAFGAWGKYSKDLIGLPIATAAGVDTSGHFRANPFLGPVGGTISNMYGKAISPLTKMQSDSTAKRERSLSNFISTAIDAGTPLNNATFQTLSSNLTGKRIGDLIGEIAVKGDMAGRAGSPGGSAPNFARGRGSRWYSQRRQPDSLSDTPNFNQVVDTFLPKIPPPVEPQQATQPPASPNPLTAEDLVRSGKGSASSSLADMLQQRKQ